MPIPRIGLTALLLLGSVQFAAGQSGSVNPEPATTVARNETVDVSRLPIDLERIQRKLRQVSVREEREGLNLRYFIDVYGQLPRLEILTDDDNLVYGPVPYGAPTHKEMIEHVTPKEYRAPAADVSGLFRWLADRGKKDKKE